MGIAVCSEQLVPVEVVVVHAVQKQLVLVGGEGRDGACTMHRMHLQTLQQA